MLSVGGHKVRSAGMKVRKARRRKNRKVALVKLVARQASKG